MITIENVLEALRNVDDPDLKKDIVTLGMVKDVKVDGKKVNFTVVLTTPACPMKEMIHKACVNAIIHFVDKEAQVDVFMTADVTSRRKDGTPLMPGVKNIIAIASGKGGVGKSTISSNLACGLAKKGYSVGYLDADIYGPSAPLMFDLQHDKPKLIDVDGHSKLEPIVQYGVKVLSIGFFADLNQAVVWRGPMASSAIRQFITDVDWGELDYLVIDMPPGTGDIHLTIMQTVPVTGVVIVTTPQTVALADAKKAIAMFGQANIKVPIIGLVENMAYFTPEELPNNKYYLFGKEGGRNLAEEYDLPFLGQIPLVQSIREGGDEGVPAMVGKDEISKDALRTVVSQAVRQIAIRNANLPKTETINVE
jgi:ATP-binding protein involved in chromosome partitioning